MNNETSSVLTTQPVISCSATSTSTYGTYTITPSGATAANYDITYVNGVLSITQVLELTYGDLYYDLGRNGVWTSSNPDVAWIQQGDENASPRLQRSYLHTSSAGSATITGPRTILVTVNKAPLTITAKSYTINQGDPLPDFGVEYSGFINNVGMEVGIVDNENKLTTKPTVSCAATSTSAPGTYDINVSGAVSDKYSMTYVKGTLTINPKDASTLTINPIAAVTYNGSAQTPAVTVKDGSTTLTNGTDYTVSYSDNTNAGTATVTVTGKGNYTGTKSATFTINKAALTITANSYTINQGDAFPEFDVNISGFVNNETETVLTKQPTVTCEATTTNEPGEYDINASGAEAGNYDITYVPGKLTITGEITPTDISQMDNVIYIEPMEEKTGSQATISLKMKNSAAIRGFQFDLYLPESVTVVKSSKGKIQGSLSAGRLPDEDEHTLTFSEQADGAIRFLCSSQYDETFTGNDGEIATLKVNIADNMEDGEYPIQLKNMKLTETNISNFYETALVQTKLTISSYVVGDINGDDVVDVSDYTGVANHIHGNTPDGFNAKAADVDENGVIDVSDYTGIANIIHTGSIYGNNNASARMLSPRKANTDLNTYDNVMYISPFTASAGTQTTLSIKMKNTAEIRGFQFDLYLPEGMTVVKSNKGRIQGALSAGRLPDEDEHELTFSEQADGAIRFLCSSQYDETFTGNDGEIATLQVDIANSMADGDYPILLKDMKLTETDISKYYTADLIETTVTIGEVDTRTILDETSTTVPEAANNVDVRVLRTIKADEWSTICLPFAMSTAQVKEAFGDDVKIANFTGYEATTDGDDNVTGIKVNFAEVDAIEANHPYVIKVSSAISEFTVDNVDIDPEDEPKVATVVRTKKRWSEMIGTYVANTTIENQMLFLNGNKFWYSNGSTKMKGYRAYFDFYDVLSEVENASAKITFFDGTTEITNVNLRDNVNEDAPRYNLAGQKVSKSYKGIVIQNGVKRVIK